MAQAETTSFNTSGSPASQSRTQSATRPVSIGGLTVDSKQFTVIAGPCSIESHEQFLATAKAVKSAGACLLRGGIWKLRTNPNSFQGLGIDASGMIQEVLAAVKMGLTTEVTDPRQIEAVDSLVSLYQVGARNMHNYALLKELAQTKKPVLLKRNFAATIEEWVKAAEYLTLGGNNNVILCERGIRTFENATRFTFDLNAVVWLKQNTDFPVIVDPSHAVGIASMVPQLSLASAAAGADGLIIEVHPEPAKALSDGKQSLTFAAFEQLMQDLERILAAVHRPLQRLSL